jgi:hypothetical protein
MLRSADYPGAVFTVAERFKHLHGPVPQALPG